MLKRFRHVVHTCVRPSARWSPGLFLVFILFGGFVFVHGASAQFISLDTISGGIIQGLTWLFLAVARMAIALSVAFLRIFMEIAAYNGYIDAPPVLLGWYMVRDFANMFFVVALLAIAFGTILGLEQYEWKKSLVKLILAAILINFSRLIIGVAIDASHIFTITFLNAVEGAAAGNLVGMLQLDNMMSFITGKDPTTENFTIEVLIAGIMAMIFGIVAAIAIGAYLVVMAARVVVLWIMIIVSPLVFIMSAIPQAKTYADQFWRELSKYIIVAPTMVFFLWLAFATLGSGDINNHVGVSGQSIPTGDVNRILQIGKGKPGASLSAVSSWENMSAFIIAIAFLFIGLIQTQKIGVVGGGVVGGAINFGKQVATIASGYAAGRFLVGAAGKGIRKAAYEMPVVGGKELGERWKITKGKIGGWMSGKGYEVTETGKDILKEIEKLNKQLTIGTEEGQKELKIRIELAQKKEAELKEQIEQAAPEQKARLEAALKETQEGRLEAEQSRAKGLAMSEAERKALEEKIAVNEEDLSGEMGGGIIGRVVRRRAGLEKQVAKVEKQAEARKEILRKRTSSEAVGGLFGINLGMGSEGWFGGRFLADRYGKTPAQDRIEQGWLQAEELRSRAKDLEKQTEGRFQALGAPRLKYDAAAGKLKYEFEKGTMADQIEDHKFRGEIDESRIHHLTTQAQERIYARSEQAIEELKKNPALEKLTQEIKNFEKETTRLRMIMADLRAFEKTKQRVDAGDVTAKKDYDKQLEMIKKALPDFDPKKIAEVIQNQSTALVEKSTNETAVRKDYAKEFEHLLEKQSEKSKKDLLAWEVSRNKAETQFSDLFFGGKKEDMVNRAAQEHIWNREGIQTPNTALQGIVEDLERVFRDMNYEAAVAAIGDHFDAIQKKRGSGEAITFKDEAISQALLRKLESGKWIDDAIIGFRSRFKEVYGKAPPERRSAGRAAGPGGFTGDQLRSMADVVKQILGDGARELVTALEGEPKRLRKALEDNEGGVANVGPVAFRPLGVDGATPRKCAGQLADILENLSPEQRKKLLELL